MSGDLVRPFAAGVDGASGGVDPAGVVSERRLSDLRGLFRDAAALERAVGEGDEVVYRVVAAPVPEVEGEVPFSVTTIEAGRVGDEFYMTRGHAHPEPQGELYFGLSGRGVLLMYDGEEVRWVEMRPGVAGYIPPGWAHRTANVGEEPFRFLAVYPGSAGHDYAIVAEGGMGARVVRSAAGYEVVEEPGGADPAVREYYRRRKKRG